MIDTERRRNGGGWKVLVARGKDTVQLQDASHLQAGCCTGPSPGAKNFRAPLSLVWRNLTLASSVRYSSRTTAPCRNEVP